MKSNSIVKNVYSPHEGYYEKDAISKGVAKKW